MRKLLTLVGIIVCTGLFGQIGGQVHKLQLPSKKLSEQSKPLLSPDGRTLYFVNSFDAPSERRIVSQDIWKIDWQGEWENLVTDKVNELSSNDNNAVVGFDEETNEVFLLGTYSRKEVLKKGLVTLPLDDFKSEKPTEQDIRSLYIKWDYYDFYKPSDANVLFISIVDIEDKMSLYVSERIDEKTWSKPEPLIALNTAFFHEFAPFYDTQNDVLYFSSDREGGIGGVDIYRAKKNGETWTSWSEPELMKPPVSSLSFDAYFSTYGERGSFFVSDRGEQFSSMFYMESLKKYEAVDQKKVAINDSKLNGFYSVKSGEVEHPKTGSFEYNGLPAEGVKVYLFDEDGNMIEEAMTDENGEYKFELLAADDIGFVKYEYPDTIMNYDLFEFKRLGADDVVLMSPPTENYSNIESNDPRLESVDMDSAGMQGVFSYQGLPKSGITIMLYDENGDVVGTAITNERGEYDFQGLPADHNYEMKIFDAGSELNMEYVDFKPQKLSRIDSELALIDLEDPRLVDISTEAPQAGKFNYGALPQEGVKIIAYDEDGNVVATTMTDENGEYQFAELPADKKVFVKFLVEDTELNMDLVEVAPIIEPVEETMPEETDPVEEVLVEEKEGKKIYYGFNEVYPTREYLRMLDKEVLPLKGEATIILEGHTDNIGTFETNLFVSMLRAEIVKAYLVRYGFESSDVQVAGHGPTMPVESNDTPEGRDLNRRLVLTIEDK